MLCQNGYDVRLTHDEILDAFELEFLSGIFTVEYLVAYLDNHLFVLGAFATSYYFALEGLLLGGVRNNDATDGLFFCRCGFDQHAVCQWLNLHNCFDVYNSFDIEIFRLFHCKYIATLQPLQTPCQTGLLGQCDKLSDKKSQRHFTAGYAMFGILSPQEDLSAIDDVDAWGQVVMTFVDGLAQKIVDGRSACFVGRYSTDGCIVGAQGLEFVECAESLVVVVVPQTAIEPRFDDDGAGVPRCSAIAVLFGEPPVEAVRIVVLEELGDHVLGECKLSGFGGRPSGLEVIFGVAGVVLIEIGRLDNLHRLRGELILECGERSAEFGTAQASWGTDFGVW